MSGDNNKHRRPTGTSYYSGSVPSRSMPCTSSSMPTGVKASAVDNPPEYSGGSQCPRIKNTFVSLDPMVVVYSADHHAHRLDRPDRSDRENRSGGADEHIILTVASRVADELEDDEDEDPHDDNDEGGSRSSGGEGDDGGSDKPQRNRVLHYHDLPIVDMCYMHDSIDFVHQVRSEVICDMALERIHHAQQELGGSVAFKSNFCYSLPTVEECKGQKGAALDALVRPRLLAAINQLRACRNLARMSKSGTWITYRGPGRSGATERRP